MGIKDWFGRFRKRKAVPAEEIIEETTVEETVAGSEDPATGLCLAGSLLTRPL